MRTMKPHTNPEEITALCRLIRCANSSMAARQLLERYRSAAAALDAGPRIWRDAGLSQLACTELSALDHSRTEQDLAWCLQDNHHLIGWHDEDYPALLRHVDSPPAALFVMGDINALWHPQIAVVGSRHASHTGKHIAEQFAAQFVSAGWAVTSGLAQGIDTYAHLGALHPESKPCPATVAVVATGLDVVYPESNRSLMQRIAQRGAVVSEHPPGTPPLREHFPSRNRIIAGLSLACLVVEAAQRSGALITARLANELGKEVFAIPGSIQNPMSRGCHQLIRQGAVLTEHASEVIEALEGQAQQLADVLRGRLAAASVSAHETALLQTVPLSASNTLLEQALGYELSTLDQLCERTGLTPSELSSMLLIMEMEGRIAQQQGRYIRLI
jgi:DNA processing protein